MSDELQSLRREVAEFREKYSGDRQLVLHAFRRVDAWLAEGRKLDAELEQVLARLRLTDERLLEMVNRIDSSAEQQRRDGDDGWWQRGEAPPWGG